MSPFVVPLEGTESKYLGKILDRTFLARELKYFDVVPPKKIPKWTVCPIW